MTSLPACEGAPRSRVYRAELIRCWQGENLDGFNALARTLGYEESDEPASQLENPMVNVGESPPLPEKPEVPESKPSEPSSKAWPFWRVMQFEPRESPPKRTQPKWYRDAQPFQAEEWGPNRDNVPPTPPDLMPWRKLWVFLHRALGKYQQDGKLDLNAVVGLLASNTWPRRLPRMRRLRWQQSAILIADYQDYLEPIWRDMNVLRERLDALRPQHDLQTWIVKTGFQKHWYQAEKARFAPFDPPIFPAPVLVLGDLGQLDANPNARESWLNVGKRLKRCGCLPIALVPLPKHRWDADLARVWHMTTWDVHTHIPCLTKRGLAQTRADVKPSSKVDTDVLEALLTLLAPGVGIEPELLREIRMRLFPDEEIDIEIAAWNHPHLERFDGFIAIDQAFRDRYREKFAEKSIRPKATQALALMAQYHCNWPKKPAFEEQLQGELLLGRESKSTKHYFERLAKSLDPNHPTRVDAMRRMGQRRSSSFWKKSMPAIAAWLKVRWPDIVAEREILPDGVDIFDYLWLLKPDDQEREVGLFWQGGQLLVKPKEGGDRLEELRRGSMLLNLRCHGALAQIYDHRDQSQHGAALDASFSLSLKEPGSFSLSTDSGIYTFFSKEPNLNGKASHDRLGPKMMLRSQGREVTTRWLPPSPIRIMDRQGQVVGQCPMLQGCWMAEDQRTLFADSSFHQPNWVETLGVDDYGIFAEVGIEKVPLRFRWIFPGTFLMGSPEDEPGRVTKGESIIWGDETQHQVTHTRGFWLAETTVTQALWQAVMGKNPSDFKGEDLPVDSVSWNDAGAFIDKLNQRYPDLKLRLSSEAQWEYACRAGTTTAYHFGQSITTDQVNYNGNHPNEGSPKGAYRQTTVAVRALPANGWGLYQMHGNVWEWCADWLGVYVREPQVDPQGPDSGRLRVLRGGSWLDDGGDCRSADRSGATPGSRDHLTGFRLARGQEALQQAPGRTEAGDRHRSGQGGGEST